MCNKTETKLANELSNNKKVEVNNMKSNENISNCNKNLVEQIANELKVNANIRSWYMCSGWKKIKDYMDDVDGIFSTDNGYKVGVYGVYVVTPLDKEILMYIGEVGKEGRGFRDRIMEHAKYWLDNSEYYAGVKAEELKCGYKYRVKILAEEKNDDKRYELEQSLIEQMKPYVQFNCYPKHKSEYKGYDLAIFGTYRRRAFIVARDGKYTEEAPELLIDSIYELRNKVDFNEYRTAKPDKEIVELIEKEMPKGSDVWRNVKDFVEENMGITSARGCRYSYLVKIVAAALEPVYKIKMAL